MGASPEKHRGSLTVTAMGAADLKVGTTYRRLT